MKPLTSVVTSVAVFQDSSDEELVAATRAGSDHAFEALFRRYRVRINAYAARMVSDHGRAEDVVQETFVSALRSLRASEQPIAFKPWVYQITRNACIDQIRRSGRAEEISIDSAELNPTVEDRLSQRVPQTENAASQRLAIDNLWQAFGGLSQSQHEILVLRELEGLSYDEISRKMNLTTSSVRSMLFTARRGLREEYDEIENGDRCRRVQTLMSEVAEGMGGRRDRRMVFRHVRHCMFCRHEAVALGIDRVEAEERPGRVRSAASKAAALLPFPFLFRRKENSSEGFTGSMSTAHVQSSLSQLSVNVGSVGAEHATSAVQKAIAVIAAAAVVGSGGVVAHQSGVDLPLIKGAHAKHQPATNAGKLQRFQSDGSGVPAAAALSDRGQPSQKAGAAPSTPQDPNSLAPVDAGAPAVTDPPAGPGGPGAALTPAAGNGVAGPTPLDSAGSPAQPAAPAKSGGRKQSQPSGAGESPSSPPTTPSNLPPGILKAPGLHGRIPPGLQRRLDPPPPTDPTAPAPDIKPAKIKKHSAPADPTAAG